MGYKNIKDFYEGRYESEFVSPYTKTAGNVDSSVMIILQDWASVEGLENGGFQEQIARLGYNPSLQSNKNLLILLQNTFNLNFSDIFVTNIFPYIKTGNMSASIPQQDFDKAFNEFCFPQIKIVNPKLIICCGRNIFLAVARYFDDSNKNIKVHNYIQNMENIYYYQRHPSPLAINSNGGIEQAKSDWIQMKILLGKSNK